MATIAPPSSTDHPSADRTYDRRWLTLAVMCLSLVVIGIDNTILNVALPTLQTDLAATTSQLQWIVDGYTLVFAGLLLTAGSLGDKYGRRSALAIGLVIFGIGSGLSALAGTPTQLIATRCLMGVGGALIMPATLSIVTNVFTVPAERARAIAIWAGCSALGIALGPLTGGYLLEHFFWGSVFLVNIPVVIIALVGGRLFVPNSRDAHAQRLDLVGAALSIVGLTAMLWAIIQAPSEGWTSTPIMAALGTAAVVLVAFVLWERRSDHPMLDVRFFENARFTAASVAVTLTFFALFGSLFLVTQYRQFVLGFSALESGVRILPFAITMMIVAPLSAKLVERVGTKLIVSAGLAITAVGLYAVTFAGPTNGDQLVIFATMIMALGMGLTMAPATESIMGSLPRQKAGVGSAVNDTTRQVGGALGVAVIGSIFSSVYAAKMTDALTASKLPVPADAAAAIKDSVGAAMQISTKVGGPAGEALANAARSAFVDGMHQGVILGAAVALLGAVIALVFLPARATDEAVELEDGSVEFHHGGVVIDADSDARAAAANGSLVISEVTTGA